MIFYAGCDKGRECEKIGREEKRMDRNIGRGERFNRKICHSAFIMSYEMVKARPSFI